VPLKFFFIYDNEITDCCTLYYHHQYPWYAVINATE